MIRNPILIKSRMLLLVTLTIYVGGLYYGAGREDYTDRAHWNTIAGFLFFITIDTLFQTLVPITLVFPT
jgi:hypothetical protein